MWYVNIYIYICIFICIYMYIYICIFIYVYIYIYYMYIYMCICSIHICIYIYIYTYVDISIGNRMAYISYRYFHLYIMGYWLGYPPTPQGLMMQPGTWQAILGHSKKIPHIFWINPWYQAGDISWYIEIWSKLSPWKIVQSPNPPRRRQRPRLLAEF